MENSISNNTTTNIEIDIAAKSTLLDSGRWATILAVIGIIFTVAVVGVGLLFVIMFLAEHSSLDSQFGQIAILIFVASSVLCIAFSIYPIYVLLRYASGIKAAIHQNDQKIFNRAISRLRNFFRYMVIGIIVSIILYVLSCLVLLAAVGLYEKI